ncbi:MAG: ABC transporter ATP-binding protein [Lachnospiraceae bacterium]|nr:ABC transporter ATP-binding protein [Lachnospiraceae bacterium]
MIDTLKKILELLGEKGGNIKKAVAYHLVHSIFASFELFAVLYIMIHIEDLTGNDIWISFGILIAGIIGKFICKWRTASIVSNTAYDVFQEKRLVIGESLKKAPMGYFNANNLGSIQAAVTTGINELEANAVAVLESMMGNTIYADVSTIVLMIFNWKIGLITLAGIAVNFLVLNWIQNSSDQFAIKQVSSKELMTSRVMEFVKGIMTMRLFARSENDLERINEAYKEKKEADLLVENTVTWPVNMYAFVYKIVSCIVILSASVQYLNGKISFAFCVMFLFSAFLLYAQMSSMGASIALLKVVRVALNHFENVYNMPIMAGEKELLVKDGFDIQVKNISFGYTESKRVINDVSMSIPFGSSVAIVGPSGGGKTTVCNLIGRFFDVDGGKILIGGKELRELQPDSLMEHMSFVFQNVYLFGDTIENNVKFGKLDASHEEVVEACKKARCHDFIMSLPDDYSTFIGEGGATLSGGEKQRISIARAIIKNAQIIILDEATSSVDPENENLLVEAIEELGKNKTVISIAHRLSTVRKADCIYVISDGSVVQAGKHSELMKVDGIYRKFIEIRSQSLEWGINT